MQLAFLEFSTIENRKKKIWDASPHPFLIMLYVHELLSAIDHVVCLIYQYNRQDNVMLSNLYARNEILSVCCGYHNGLQRIPILYSG